MKSKRINITTTIAAAIGLSAILGCQIRNANLQVHVERRTWELKNHQGTILETNNYLIHTTVKDNMFLELAPILAQSCHKRFTKQLKIPPKPGKMQVYVFSDRREWEAYTRAYTGSRAEAYLRIRSGGFVERDRSVLYYIGRYAMLTVMAHELFHQYLQHNQVGRVPAWLNEGLACFFEAHEWQNNQPVFTSRRNLFRLRPLYQAMLEGQLFSLEELISTHPGKVMDLSTEKVAAYYSQVWALIQFLRYGQDGKYAQAFDRLLADLGTAELETRTREYIMLMGQKDSEPVNFGRATLMAYVPQDIETLERQYRQYIRKLIADGKFRLDQKGSRKFNIPGFNL